MTVYTQVPKPNQTAYSQATFQGKQIYDDPNVLYDDPNVFYDSTNFNQYNLVPKPTQTAYTLVNKPT